MHLAACIFLLRMIDERMAVPLQRPVGTSRVRIQPTARLDSQVSCLLHGLDGKILDGLYDDETLSAHPCDHRRSVFVVMPSAGLTFLAAMTRPASQGLCPAVLGLAFLTCGVIEFIRFDRARQLAIHFI